MAKKNEKKNVVLVFGITRDYVFALANVLIGLKKYNKTFWDDIIVYHDGIAEHEKKSLNRILPIKFVDLSKEEHFEKIANSEMNIIEKYSIAAFYRYECLRLLDEYHQVIWSDVDILIQGDISDLVNYGKKTGVAFSLALPNFVLGSSLKRLISEYRMFVPLWNDGIMVLNDNLPNYLEIYQWCIDATIKYQDVLLWPDLAILNLMLQEYKIEPEDIEREKYVCLPTSENVNQAKIVHAYGDKKFWNNLAYMEDFTEWINNAVEWSKIAYVEAKKETPLVSCVMSCYERYDYLVESIYSILAQTYANFEIIVVLEKSKTQSQIEEVLRDIDDSRIRIVKNKEKLGFADSLNIGIDMAKGEYVARIDDDDVAVLRRIEMQVAYMENHPKVGIVGGNMIVFGHNNGTFLTFKDYDDIKAATLVGTPFMHPTVMMRKSMLDKYRLRYDSSFFTEDYELWSRAVYSFECANIPQPLMFYRSHDNQSTSASSGSNEYKIHESHKRVMSNQLKKQLGINLNDNELEVLQARRNRVNDVGDIEGVISLRREVIRKILQANEEKKIYNDESLEYVLNFDAPLENGKRREYLVEVPMKNETNKIKKGLKKVIKPVLMPIYGRWSGRMEELMMAHDEELRLVLQRQLDELNAFKERVKNKNED